MTADVTSLGAVSPVTTGDAPEIRRHQPDLVEVEEGMGDATAAKIFGVGLAVGTVVMTVVVFLLGLLAGLDPGVAAAVAPVPGGVAGAFVGMTAYLGTYLARHGH